MTVLPAAPSSAVDEAGEPRFGAYHGWLPEVRWDGLAARNARSLPWRALHAKRWHYLAILGPRVIAAAESS